MARKFRTVVYVLMAVFALVAGSAQAATTTVNVVDDSFRSATTNSSSVTIQQGDTVTWNWTGSSTHNVTSTTPSGVLNSGNLKKPATYSHTFTEAPGAYRYECTRHGGMTGTVTVVGSDTTPPPAPTASPRGGTYNATQSVALTDSESGVTIRYTTDGSTPTGSSTAYSGPVTISSSRTLKAIAIDGAGNQSGVTTEAYVIDTAAPPAPTASPAPGTYARAQSVSLADAEAGTVIRYTTDGSTPDGFSTQYSLPINVDRSMTIRAIAVDGAGNRSPVGSFAYTIDGSPPPAPTASPDPGTYGSAQTVSLSDAKAGATIRYTTDGSTPTTASPQYTGAITVDRSMTIKALAVDTAGNQSSVASFAYVIDTTAPGAPTGSPPPGTYGAAQDVALAAEAGATIRYTTDGSAPTDTSAQYGSPIHVTSTTTIKAIATDAAGNRSPVASLTYTIEIDTTAPPAPTADPPAGRYDAPQDVRLAVADPGAVVHYTTDGTDPTAASPAYSAPIHVDGRVTIKALAVDRAGNAGDVATFAYLVSAPAPPAQRVVSVGGYTYSPGEIIVNKGETVTWTWTGPDFNHTVTSDGGRGESFESHPGVPDASVDAPSGGKFDHKFDSVGSYGYYCRLHPEMRGTVTVVESGAPAEQTPAAPAADQPASAASSEPAPAAAPAPGARDWSVDVANMKFTPDDLTVEQGDSVTWRWTGADTNHSVTSDPGQPEKFESHPGVGLAKLTAGPPGGTFSHTFANLGTTTYFCRLHPDMKGTVRVVPRGAGPAAGPDTAALRLAKSRLALRGRRLTLRLTTSAAARMRLQVWSRARGAKRAKRLLSFTRRAKAGQNAFAFTLPARAVRPGSRLRVVVLGSDAAGNAARPLGLTITVPKSG